MFMVDSGAPQRSIANHLIAGESPRGNSL